MERAFDAIVIGSGFGGGVTACRLAEAGWSVAVLERGRRFARTDFPDRAAAVPRMLWHPQLNPRGLFELRLFGDLAVLTGVGVGGGSLIYASVEVRPDADAFASHWPLGTDSKALDRYFGAVEEALDVRPVPDPAPRKVHAFARAARLAGGEAERVPLAVHFGAARDNPFGGRRQEGCTNLGRCMTGCPRHAKNTIDLTYLARAEANGASVLPLHEVHELRAPRTRAGLWRVGFKDHETGRRGRVDALVVILAAGALGSTRLLLRNRGRLPHLSKALGTRFSANGNALGAVFGATQPGTTQARVEFGPSITSRYRPPGANGFMIEDLGLPLGAMGLLEAVRGAQRLPEPWRSLVRVKRLAARARVSDRSIAHVEASGVATAGPGYDDALFMLLVGRDRAPGRMRVLRPFGTFDVSFSRRDEQPLFDRMATAISDLAGAVGGTGALSADIGPLGLFLTAHPLGGCPMSHDRDDGVVDPFGRVHGYEDSLRVLDGSIVPAALGSNPSLTIAALAERGVEQLIASGEPQ